MSRVIAPEEMTLESTLEDLLTVLITDMEVATEKIEDTDITRLNQDKRQFLQEHVQAAIDALSHLEDCMNAL